MWMQKKQQPLKKKGNRWGIHICGWVSEETGHQRLSDEQIAAQAALPEDQCLPVTDSHIIIYPGKGFDNWWDLKQLMNTMVHAINIFEHTHPGKVGVFLFDCSSTHEGLAPDALNINSMNVNPGGKQKHLQSTTIPLNNPPLKPGQPDTCGQPQTLLYSTNHPDLNLQGKPKGLKAVLQERESVWDKMAEMNKSKVPPGKCRECKKSDAKKEAERHVAEAEAMGQEDTIANDNMTAAHDPIPSPIGNWCCMYWVLSLQDDFANKKPMIQNYIKH